VIDGTSIGPIFSFKTSISNPATLAGGGGAGKAVFTPVEVTRDFGDKSPSFNVNVSTGRHINSAKIIYGPTVADGPTLTVDLTDGIFREVDVEQRATGTPRETLAFDYTAIRYTFALSGQPSTVVQFNRATSEGGGGSIPGQYVFLGGLTAPAALSTAIPIVSFNHGVSAPALAFGGGAAGRAIHRDFSIQRVLDAQTLAELGACMSGSHASSVVLRLVRPDSSQQPAEWFRYTLTDALVTSLALETDGAGQLQESISLAYRAIEWRFDPPGTPGQVGSFDVAANR